MIETIKIAQVATYVEAQSMENVAHLNFIFGANGAGKTTIGRALAKLPGHEHCVVRWRGGAPMETLVYNRDFVEVNFGPVEDLKGIFTLGQTEINNEAAIAAAKLEIDQLNQDIAQRKGTLGLAADNSGMVGKLAALSSAFQDRCWEQKQKHDAAFQAAFSGVRGSRATFTDRVLLLAGTNQAELRPLAELTERAKTVFGPIPSAEARVPSLSGEALVALESHEILGKRVVGKGDVNIADMIHRLGHSDWVKEGQGYFKHSAPACPFCQQPAPHDFEKILASYFDETFELDTATIARLQADYATQSQALSLRLQAVGDADCRFLDKAAFAAEQAAIEALMRTNALVLSNKRKEPSAPQRLEALAPALAAASKLVDAANNAVADHNKIVANFKSEHATLVGQVWRHIIAEELKAIFPAYVDEKKKVDAAIQSLNQQIRDAESRRAAATLKLRQLERESTSSKPTVDSINGMLKSYGFKTFSLAPVDDGPRYKLVRQDGKDARHSLSEGEKSFVTFLYFYHLIKGSEHESGMTTDRVVVFDDPVSSLDSEVLFIVSSLIRALFEDMRKGTGQVKQIFVLTHNVYFHKEVSFNGGKATKPKDREKGAKNPPPPALKTKYWVVRKGATGPRLECHDKNPINTTYDLLWKEIGRDDRNPLTIQNTMRRILEHYFKILGGVDFDELCDKFQGEERTVCRSLLSWVNDGSHYSHDDAHYAFGDDAIAAQLDIFKKIFERTNHGPHYDMMMDA